MPLSTVDLFYIDRIDEIIIIVVITVITVIIVIIVIIIIIIIIIVWWVRRYQIIGSTCYDSHRWSSIPFGIFPERLNIRYGWKISGISFPLI